MTLWRSSPLMMLKINSITETVLLFYKATCFLYSSSFQTENPVNSKACGGRTLLNECEMKALTSLLSFKLEVKTSSQRIYSQLKWWGSFLHFTKLFAYC